METKLNLPLTEKLVHYGIERAREQNLDLSIAIVDASGHLLHFVRMDEAALVTIKVAMGKARTAAYLKAPSKIFEDMIKNGEQSLLSVPDILPLQGGIPLMNGTDVVGAVGVSGATGDKDHWMATDINRFYQQI